MTPELSYQITGLQKVHKELTEISESKHEVTLSGSLPFEASAEGFDPIIENFEIELIISNEYPQILPRVREIGGKIEDAYDHINQDKTLCLAVPVEERRLFSEQPSLLGFVNNLVIPYFYGYCYWKRYGKHPFDEQDHGAAGIVQYYLDLFHLKSEISVLAIVSYLLEYRYRGHHSCPCGSGKKVRRCHGIELRDLNNNHTEKTLKDDFISVLSVCLNRIESSELPLSEPLRRQVLRLLRKIES